jgi:signal transduction histidine kinase
LPIIAAWRLLSLLASKALVSSGLGLISMRERLAQIGGRLQIESTQGHTLLKAAIPLY